MKNTSLGILNNLKESIDFPKFEQDLMDHIVSYLEELAEEGKAEISNIETFVNMEGSHVCKYTLEGETFLVSVDML